MLITELKPKETIISLVGAGTVVISCEGCKELYFPESEALSLGTELLESGLATALVVTEYICNPDNLRLQLEKYASQVDDAGTILVLSCGVGVQTVAGEYPDKKVYAACDTYQLPVYQGVTPLEYDCDQCGECYLNSTGGVCPITACSKSLVNGKCGGTKNGKCEVDADMDCGWELIYRRLEKLGLLDTLVYPVKARNYNASA